MGWGKQIAAFCRYSCILYISLLVLNLTLDCGCRWRLLFDNVFTGFRDRKRWFRLRDDKVHFGL